MANKTKKIELSLKQKFNEFIVPCGGCVEPEELETLSKLYDFREVGRFFSGGKEFIVVEVLKLKEKEEV